MGMDAPRHCPVCQAQLNPSYAFCHNCGTLVQQNPAHMPTMRAGTEMSFTADGQETMRASGNTTPPAAAPPTEENKGV
jgi:predicted amidophosphoribosyltransferase